MDFEVRWTLPAAADFQKLAEQIEKDTDFIESQRVVGEIFESIKGLQRHPHIGQRLNDYPQLRRQLSSGFKIIYQVFDGAQTIEITRILHQRQDVARNLKRTIPGSTKT